MKLIGNRLARKRRPAPHGPGRDVAAAQRARRALLSPAADRNVAGGYLRMECPGHGVLSCSWYPHDELPFPVSAGCPEGGDGPVEGAGRRHDSQRGEQVLLQLAEFRRDDILPV